MVADHRVRRDGLCSTHMLLVSRSSMSGWWRMSVTPMIGILVRLVGSTVEVAGVFKDRTSDIGYPRPFYYPPSTSTSTVTTRRSSTFQPSHDLFTTVS